MKKLEVTAKDNMKSIIYMLLAAKERGEKVYAEYNGQVLYSDMVSISDIYKSEVKNNKKEYLLPVFDGLPVYGDNDKKGYVLPSLEELPTYDNNGFGSVGNTNREKQMGLPNDNAMKRVPEWIREGKALIRSSKFAFWQETVMTRSIDLYKGEDLDVFLDIMKNMRDGVSMDDIVSSYIRTEYSEMFRAFVNFLIKEFSDKSEEFFKIYDAQRAIPKNVNWNAYNPSLKPHKKRVRSKGKE